jgi:hypothetical protein
MDSPTPTFYRFFNELERLRAEDRVLLEEIMHKDGLIVDLRAEVERLRRVLAIIANRPACPISLCSHARGLSARGVMGAASM